MRLRAGSRLDLGDAIAAAKVDLDLSSLPQAASIGLAALLIAALLTLLSFEASAQAFGPGDCAPPPNSFFAIGDPDFGCGSLDPGITIYRFSDLEMHYTNCGVLPPNVAGSAVAVPLDGVMVFGFVSFCSGPDPDCGYYHCGNPSGYSVPVNPTLHVSFNHEAGSTRFYDITTDSFSFGFDCDNLDVGPGSGAMTVEDRGGGTFLFNSTIDVVLTEGGCNYPLPAKLILSSTAQVDVPAGRAAIALTLSPAFPSPVRSRATIEFTLPSAGPVHLAVYDVSGRQVASVLDAESMPAGPHQVSLSTGDLRSGCYFYRLLTRDGARTQAMLVLR